ncbi:MAG: helix-turn-helix domain-containing protein [Clostridia bacterium]|nr:helix-turn-helix domain-containing protein [Clostridia bacterium]
MDNKVAERIQQVLGDLNTPVYLLDRKGRCLFPEEQSYFAVPPLEKGNVVAMDGRIFRLSNAKNDLIIMAETPDKAEAADLFCLIDALLGTMLKNTASVSDIGNAYQRLLQNELSVSEAEAVIEEYRIKRSEPRCVILIHIVQTEKASAYEILSEVLPRENGDVIVPMDHSTVAYLRDASNMEDEEEMLEFAQAARETVISETGYYLTIGIGNVALDVTGLYASYRQARRAIEIGRIYLSDESIYEYRSMLLQRFLSDLSPELAEHYHRMLFNASTDKLFNDEMLATIDMFLKKDLNLSDTARQLYIHRNTLVYRLDKVQRQVGLDLRKFDDAVTFRMLFEMKKCVCNKLKITD